MGRLFDPYSDGLRQRNCVKIILKNYKNSKGEINMNPNIYGILQTIAQRHGVTADEV